SHYPDAMKGTLRTHHLISSLLAAVVAAAMLVVAGCGSGGGSSGSAAAATGPAGPTPSAATAAPKGSCGSRTPPASPSEAASTAAGDIPDNQQFLTFKNGAGGYSISYPEGWARAGNGSDVTFQDKSNTIAIKVAAGAKPTPASVSAGLKQEA